MNFEFGKKEKNEWQRCAVNSGEVRGVVCLARCFYKYIPMCTPLYALTYNCPILNKAAHTGDWRWQATLGVAVSIIHRTVPPIYLRM